MNVEVKRKLVWEKNMSQSNLTFKELMEGLNLSELNEIGLYKTLGNDSSYLYIPYNNNPVDKWLGYMLVHLVDGIAFIPVSEQISPTGCNEFEPSLIHLLTSEIESILLDTLSYLKHTLKQNE
ncbi:hypothetical protein [Paenibacillus terrae]|uniref:Uncharacterized protein n=1 Tax=Paenibacillus terrae TaxID=159743 RepID=A0A0D7WXV2_9BACL|nr:hypothetical protein [Paenibacillus terrae]KJD44000.1 hypothetical protein QD47_19535 [Paenibacillus terrae]